MKLPEKAYNIIIIYIFIIIFFLISPIFNFIHLWFLTLSTRIQHCPNIKILLNNLNYTF